jgi:tetratricopeptide (TPR) repeat protein
MAQAAMSFEVEPMPAPLQAPRPIAASEVMPAPAWTATFDDLGLDEDASADELRGAALMLLQLGEPAQAHDVAQRLLQTSPGGAYGYLLAGAALQELGKIADARRVYQMCVELADRDQPGQLLHLSECRALAGR